MTPTIARPASSSTIIASPFRTSARNERTGSLSSASATLRTPIGSPPLRSRKQHARCTSDSMTIVARRLTPDNVNLVSPPSQRFDPVLPADQYGVDHADEQAVLDHARDVVDLRLEAAGVGHAVEVAIEDPVAGIGDE